VAFAAPGAEEGEVIVAVEPVGLVAEPDLAARVRSAVSDTVGLMPRRVVVVAADTIPRAANGKLQRLAAGRAYARGELG
jgi:acyl-coenzyme A synthetase/AMP-(fatty) acid ligase